MKKTRLNSRPTGNYEVTIETGTDWGAGTDSTVLLTIQGTLGSTELQFSGAGGFFDSGRYPKRLEIFISSFYVHKYKTTTICVRVCVCVSVLCAMVEGNP